MKTSLILFLTLMGALALVSHAQTPYDPAKDYNITLIDWWPFNSSLTRYCDVLSADGTYCEKCMNGTYQQGDWINGKFNAGPCTWWICADNCYGVDWTMNCILCQDGYFLNQTVNDLNLCVPKTFGCQNYDSVAKKCKTCLPGWTMNTTINGASNQSEYHCYFVPDINCVKYDSNNTCLQCATNYVVVNNRCVFWLPNCATMNGNVCSKCNTNYQLDATGKCVAIPKISNCLTQVDYTCSACVSGFNLVNNQCVSAVSIANCAQISGTVCSNCNSGYFVTVDGKCDVIPKIANCLNQVDFTCSSCVSGYTLTNNQCVYVIDNCAQVSGQTCTKCNTNYAITVDGKCSLIPRIANCASQVDYTCSSCATGYALANNQCTYIIDNCAVVNGMTCSKCNTNYELTIDGKCSLIARIPNCASQVDYTCSSCVTGWALSNNKCTYVIDNCAQVNGMVCAKCNTDYSITVDGKCSYIPRISNCASQVDYTCSSCATGFALVNNACVYVISNCAQVTGMTCAKCNTDYAITTDGKCSYIPRITNCASQVDSTCSLCLTGFILSNNQCIAATPNCLEYTGALCSKCQTNFLLTNSSLCIPKVANCLTQVGILCVQCNSGFSLANNICTFKIENCLKVTGTTCDQCKEGFIASNGKCIEDPFYNLDMNCRLYDQTTFNKCLACSGGFFLNFLGRCEQVDPLCKTFNGNNGFCLSCFVGYTLDNARGKCLKTVNSLSSSSDPNVDNCNQYDYVKNVCVKCAEGCYFDANGKCQKFSDVNCKTPSADLKSCAECYKGYAYDSTQGKCVVGEFNCATWSNGKCATCPKGFYLDSNSMCIAIDPNCYLFNPTFKTCVVCYPGYLLDSDKKCKLVQEVSPSLAKYSMNCAKFVDQQCTECYFGYYVAKDTVGAYCEKVNDLCKTYDKVTGKCTSCYLGYYLSGQGECLRYF